MSLAASQRTPACVLGGSGFIGQLLVSNLVAQGVPARLLSRRTHSHIEAPLGVEYLQGDLLDPAFDPAPLLEGCAVVFNCVGELQNESIMQALHVDATARLLEQCRVGAQRTGKLTHWVQLSSVGVYGPPTDSPSAKRCVTETTPSNPKGTYERTKAQADELVMKAADDGHITFSILRPSIVFGPYMPNGSLRQLLKAIYSQRFAYIGAPGAISSYVHVDDVVNALLHCGFERAAKNQVFNISNDVPQTSFVERVAAHYSVQSPRLRLPETVARLVSFMFLWKSGFPLTQSRIDSLVARTSYPCTKLQDELGITPTKTISEHFQDALILDKEP